jgi:hypothetical protein
MRHSVAAPLLNWQCDPGAAWKSRSKWVPGEQRKKREKENELMKLLSKARLIHILVMVCAICGSILSAQEPHHRTPFSYEFDIGGTTPAGATLSGPYSASFMIGGGASLPLGRWVSLDWASLNFGFGTTNQTQTVQVSDNTTRTTRNYQMMFSSGPRFNLPLGHRVALGLGGGYGAIVQNEYVPDRIINNGVTTIIQSVNCTVCSRNAYQGPYVEARLFGRSNKYSGFGVNAKYYIVKDSDHPHSSFQYLPPQRWLSVGVVFTFGI